MGLYPDMLYEVRPRLRLHRRCRRRRRRTRVDAPLRRGPLRLRRGAAVLVLVLVLVCRTPSGTQVSAAASYDANWAGAAVRGRETLGGRAGACAAGTVPAPAVAIRLEGARRWA